MEMPGGGGGCERCHLGGAGKVVMDGGDVGDRCCNGCQQLFECYII